MLREHWPGRGTWSRSWSWSWTRSRTTTTALLFLGLLLSLRLSPSLAAGSLVALTDTSTDTSTDSSTDVCAKVYGLPTVSEQCGYVKDRCIDSLNDAYSAHLLEYYFCNPPVIKALVGVAAVLLLVGLFKGIGLTAERYFSVILSQISQGLNIPPRLAGCTLLALGNGAPDLSSSIEAIQHGHFGLALGALMGSLMFVGCVVAGRIISISGRAGTSGLRFKAAQVRDVLFLAIAVATVGGMAFVARRITVGGVCGLMGLYAGYVILVLVADVTKTKYGIEWTGLIGFLSGSQSSELGGEGFSERLRQALLPRPSQGAGECGTDSPTEGGYSSEVEMMETPSRDLSPVRDLSSPRRTVSVPEEIASTGLISPFDAAGRLEEHVETGQSTLAPLARAATALQGEGDRGVPLVGQDAGLNRAGRIHQTLEGRIAPKYSMMTTTEYRARAFAAMSDVRSFHRADPLPLEESLTLLNLEDMIEALVDREEYAPTVAGRGEVAEPRQDRGAHTTTVYPASPHEPHGPASAPTSAAVRQMVQLLSRATDVLVIPLAFTLKATIPVVANADPGGKDATLDQSWFVRSAALSPLFLVSYFSGGVLSVDMIGASMAAVAGAILAVAAWNATTKHPHVLDRTWVAAMIGIYGFIVSAIWIGIIAEELVGIIHVFGVIAHIKPAVLGVTVLAWGNSLTDLMANIAIAMTAEGGVSMAMTACFAGPLFNILMGLGIGFALYFRSTGLSEQALDLDLIPAIGALFALLNCLFLTFIAVWHRGRLPAMFGWVTIGWYGVYMLFVAGAVTYIVPG